MNDSKEPLKLVLSRHPAVAGIKDNTLESSEGVTICPDTVLQKTNKDIENSLNNFNFLNIEKIKLIYKKIIYKTGIVLQKTVQKCFI